MDAIPREAHSHSSPTHSPTVITFLHRYAGTQSHATTNSKDPNHPFVLVNLSEGRPCESIGRTVGAHGKCDEDEEEKEEENEEAEGLSCSVS
jgi:hypothetical protein